MKLLVVVIALFALACAKHEEYIGWKSYYIRLDADSHFKAFESMVDKYKLDVLSHPIQGREGVLLVKPEHQSAFIQDVEAEGIGYKIHADDVKRMYMAHRTYMAPDTLRDLSADTQAMPHKLLKAIGTYRPLNKELCQLDYDDMLIEMQRRAAMRKGDRQLPYDNYQEIEAINDYIDYIGRQYPDVATVVNAANSFEGRPIKYVKISTTNFEDESKPVIFIDGGIHAREWISPPTVTWAIHKLVEDLTESDLLDRFDWILLPVVNPDGYKFTFTNSRFWRKTRSTDQSILSGTCPGVDGNRNYDFFWNTVGTSSTACADTYAGSRPFSEVETRVVRDILHEHLARMALYITMHSFGSMILYPWGHDGSLSQNGLGLHTVGIAMANAINEQSLPNFRSYVVGNSALVLNYRASGASEDYAHHIGVPLSYTFELPGLSNTILGFNLAPRYIQQVCNETWEGIIVGVRRAGDLFRNNRL